MDFAIRAVDGVSVEHRCGVVACLAVLGQFAEADRDDEVADDRLHAGDLRAVEPDGRRQRRGAGLYRVAVVTQRRQVPTDGRLRQHQEVDRFFPRPLDQ